MTKLKSRLKRPLFIFAMALMFIAIIGMATGGVAGQGGISPEAVPQSIIPNPLLNVNTTWNNFYSGYSPLEYNNGTGNATLHAGLSNYYINPITVNPSKVVSSALQGTVEGENWHNGFRSFPSTGISISNTSSEITIKATTTNTTATTNYATKYYMSSSYFPSANYKYDYLTIVGNYHAQTTISNGMYLWGYAKNSTGCHGYTINVNNGTAGAGSASYVQNNEPFMISMPISNLNILNISGTFAIAVGMNIPANGGSSYVNITGMALTTTPYTLGSMINSKGITEIPEAEYGNYQLNKFNPDFTYSKVANQGYTVAVSQTLQNLTISQTSINNGKYIEEATYQGNLILPDIASLTYGNANISLPITIDGSQYNVFTINGASEISNIYNKTNGTFVMSGINPMHKNTVVIETQYTASQWDKVSSPPGFFSNPVATIEYYWYIFLGITLGAIGLGAGIKGHAQGFRGAKR